MIKTIIALISIFVLSACSLNININQDPTVTPTTQNNPPTETVMPTETIPPLSIEEQLTTYFCNKFNKLPADANLTVSQNTGTHASGGIIFQGEISGAMWLAHLDGDVWTVDYDGNGTIPCQDVEQFNYPSSILSECWDNTNQTIKQL